MASILGTGLAKHTYDEEVAIGAQLCRDFAMAGLKLGIFLANKKTEFESLSSDIWSQYISDLAEQEGVCQSEETLIKYAHTCQRGLRNHWPMTLTLSHWRAVDRIYIEDEVASEMLRLADVNRVSYSELTLAVKEFRHRDDTKVVHTVESLQEELKNMKNEQMCAFELLARADEIIKSASNGAFDPEVGEQWSADYKADFGGTA